MVHWLLRKMIVKVQVYEGWAESHNPGARLGKTGKTKNFRFFPKSGPGYY